MSKASKDIPGLSLLKKGFYQHDRNFFDWGKVYLPLLSCNVTLDCNDYIAGYLNSRGCLYFCPLVKDGKLDETLGGQTLKKATLHVMKMMQERLAPLGFEFKFEELDDNRFGIVFKIPDATHDIEKQLIALNQQSDQDNQAEIIRATQAYWNQMNNDEPRERIARLLFNAFIGACLSVRPALINQYCANRDKADSMTR